MNISIIIHIRSHFGSNWCSSTVAAPAPHGLASGAMARRGHKGRGSSGGRTGAGKPSSVPTYADAEGAGVGHHGAMYARADKDAREAQNRLERGLPATRRSTAAAQILEPMQLSPAKKKGGDAEPGGCAELGDQTGGGDGGRELAGLGVDEQRDGPPDGSSGRSRGNSRPGSDVRCLGASLAGGDPAGRDDGGPAITQAQEAPHGRGGGRQGRAGGPPELEAVTEKQIAVAVRLLVGLMHGGAGRTIIAAATSGLMCTIASSAEQRPSDNVLARLGTVRRDLEIRQAP